jgi:aspartate/methionine/tyrosine aminotransferase
MHSVAFENNAALSGTILQTFLSGLGQRLYFPRGIVAQTQEAAAHHPRFSATAGLAREQGRPFMLPSLKTEFSHLSPAQAVEYAPTGGDPLLRDTWRKLLQGKNPGLDAVPFSLPLVTSGITHALSVSADLFVERGDQVLCAVPAWDNYELILDCKREAEMVRFPFFDQDRRFNVAAVEQFLSAKAAHAKTALILNFPHNPTGYSLYRDEADRLADVLLAAARGGGKLLIVVDDAYFGLFYEPDLIRESFFARLVGLHENILAVKLDGATKEDFAWGFRVGFLTIGAKGLTDEHYKALENKLLAAVRVSVSSASRPAQSLLVRLLENTQYRQEKEKAYSELASRYAKAKNLVSQHTSAYLSPLPFNSGYFLTLRTVGVDAGVLREYLLKELNTGTIALGPDLLRITYASVDEADLEELFRLVYKAAEILGERNTR